VGGDVDDLFASVQQQAGQRQPEPFGTLDGDQPLAVEGGDPPKQPLKLGRVGADPELPDRAAVGVDGGGGVDLAVRVDADDRDHDASFLA
jgi:hypothetical protein